MMPRTNYERMGFLKEGWEEEKGKMSQWKRLAVWRSRKNGSSTLAGRRRKEGETRGRKGRMVV